MASERTVMTRRGGMWASYTTLDIVVVAVLGVIFGILNGPFGIIFNALASALGPVGQNLFGVFEIGPILAIFIVRRPGAGFLCMMINAGVQILAGNPAGVLTLGWGVTQGLGIEIAFAIFRYRQYTWYACFLAGAFAQMLANVWGWYLYGFGKLGWVVLALTDILGFIDVGILSGLVGFGIGVLLKRAGVLKSFRAGTAADAQQPAVARS